MLNALDDGLMHYNSGTFEGVRRGLNNFAQGMRYVPQVGEFCNTHQSKQVTPDPDFTDDLENKTSVFLMPFNITYEAKSSLLVNGVDIFDMMEAAVEAYEDSDYRAFDFELQEAMTKVFLQSNKTKRPVDLKAYQYLSGYMSALH